MLYAKNVCVVLGAMESWYPSILSDQEITGEINLPYVIHERAPYIYENPCFVLGGVETYNLLSHC